MNPKLRKKLFFWVRIFIALIFITIIILTVDFKATWAMLKQTQPLFVMLAVGAFLVFLACLTLRWLILSRARNHPYGFFYLYRSLVIHFLFNNVLPTTIGGDVYRIMDTGGHEGKSVSFSVVWTDRMTGFIGVFAFAFLASIIYTSVSSNFLLFTIFGCIFLFAILATLAFLSVRINDWLSTWLPKIRVFRYPVGEKFFSAFRSITDYRNHKLALFFAVIVSLGVQLSLVGVWYLLFLSLPHVGSASYIHFMVTIPLVNTAAMFSVGGWGVREVAFINILGAFSVSVKPDTAFANSVLFDAVNVFFGLVGGLLLLFRHSRKPSVQHSEKKF